MLSYAELRDYMREEFKKDSAVKTTTSYGETLTEAIKLGAEKLGLPVSKVSYEIEEIDRNGFLKLKKSGYHLKVYHRRRVSERKVGSSQHPAEEALPQEEILREEAGEPVNGFFFRCHL